MENRILEKEVPSFLKVLCVLSVIGGFFSILGAVFSMFMSDPNTLAAMADIFEQSSQDMPEVLSQGLQNGKAIGIITAIFALLSITGAVFMLNLKKIGFYMYVVATISIMLVQPLFNGFDMLTVGGLIFSIIWNTLWIVSYGVHLKYMK